MKTTFFGSSPVSPKGNLSHARPLKVQGWKLPVRFIFVILSVETKQDKESVEEGCYHYIIFPFQQCRNMTKTNVSASANLLVN